MTKYQMARDVRRESRTPVDKIKAGKLYPVMAIPIKPSEGGVVDQEITIELDPIMGRMLTPIYFEATQVFVPVQAIDRIKDPAAAYAGMTEVVRDKLLSGNPLFGLEAEGEISKRCDVNPISTGGVKQVNEMVRLAYNVAVNHLRQRKYVNATLVPHSNAAVLPAILSETILDRLNGVLDPDPNIGGQVQLEVPNMSLPVGGLFHLPAAATTAGAATLVDAAGDSGSGKPMYNTNAYIEKDPVTNRPKVFAKLDGLLVGGFGLNDLHIAQRTDALTREIRQIIDDNPEFGEEYAVRYAHGLSLDKEGIPFVLGHRREAFNPMIRGAMDETGVEGDVMRSDNVMRIGLAVPVPKTELGGIIITLVCIKPDEVIASQPHPILSRPWGADNFVADQLQIDPQPVSMRHIDSDCPQANENIVAFYSGFQALKKYYSTYGLTRNVNPTTVENKTRVWQYELPMSVTPDNILYPATLDQYPWAMQTTEIATVVCATNAVLPTPMVFGPTPVEDLASITDEEIFED